MSGTEEFKLFSLGAVPEAHELARKVKELVKNLEIIETEVLSAKLGNLAVFDTKKVTTWITLMATEVAPPAQNGISFQFMKRIASASFDPNLKMKKQWLQEPKKSFMELSTPESPEVEITKTTDWI